MGQLSDKIPVTFGVVAYWAISSASGCGGINRSPAQDASSDARAPVADAPTSSIPPLGKPDAGDTPVNSGAGNATPLKAPERVRPPSDAPQ